MESQRRRKHSTRDAFIEFAMSFLEAGKPGLLRWVLQQREIFSGILRGLGNDDDETVVYVLSTLRDRVLTPESLVSPGLRSVLFGSVTLEQLVDISGREDDGLGAKLAYEVLLVVCTDPCNGLMPDLNRQPSPLKGNLKRLVDLMKKLKATEIGYHRDLLLAIVNGRPSLGSSYLDEFPYNLEDNTSPTWVSAVTLAANVVRSVRVGISWDFLNHQDHDLLVYESSDVQSVSKCICPRPFSRAIVNKGLLHSNALIKHGTLRLLLEVLKLFSSFIDTLSMNRLFSLRQKVQDEVRILLPDPQVLFTLLSSVSSIYENLRPVLKRAADSENISKDKSAPTKKLKVDVIDEDVDILVGGLYSTSEDSLPEDSGKPSNTVTMFQLDDENDDEKLIEIWGSCEDISSSDVVKNADVYFCCKVLEALKIFHGTLRAVLEVSYDLLKVLPSNPLELPSILLQSLLSTLIEHLGCSQDLSSTMLPAIYKHLQSFLHLSIHSPIRDIKEQGYVLAKAAMRSTGAFDHNPWEIGAWFLFLPGYVGHNNCYKFEECKLLQSLSSPVVSFLCDAVSTVGNSLVKYWALLKCRLVSPEVVQEQNVDFSPLVICVLDKCLRLLSSGSGAFTLPEKSMISLYVCNTMKYLLQTQVEAGTLAAVVHQSLSERIGDRISAVADAQSSFCEWRPLVCLFFFSRSILHHEACNTCSNDRVALDTSSSFANTIAEVKNFLNGGNAEVFGISKALYFTIICTTADDILEHLPVVMTVSGKLPGFHQSFMNYFYHDQSLMNRVSKLWPDLFPSSLARLRHQTLVNTRCAEFESLEYASVVFGSFLKEAPFYMLIPAIIVCDLEHYSEVKELLVSKLSNLTAEQIVSSLRLVLFWFHQIQSSYRKKPSELQECLSEICYVLVEHILAQLSMLKINSGSSAEATIPLSLCIQEVTKTVFCHPAVTAALSCPFGHDYELSEELLREASEGLLPLCGERICKMELHVLNLLTTISDYLLRMCGGDDSLSAYSQCKKDIMRAYKHLVQWIFFLFKERFNLWYRSQDITFFPVLYAILALMRFISPTKLLELANWMLAEVELSDPKLLETSSVSPVCLAFSIACAALNMLSEYLQPPNMKVVLNNLFWEIKKEGFDTTLFESIYFKAFESTTSFKIAFADICLLKALGAARSLSYRQELLPISMEMMRVIASSPIKIISHCIHSTNSTKANLLYLMVEISPLHLSVFGHLFSNVLSKDSAHRVNSAVETNYQSISDEEYLMLMPAAFSYIYSSRRKLREQSLQHVEYILSFYSRFLLDGFFNWKYIVSRPAFKVECGNILPCSLENLHNLFNSSLLGKAVKLLQWYFASNEDDMDTRLKLFCLICPCSSALEDFLDLDLGDIDSYSVDQLLNLINRVVAKISLPLILLFPRGDEKCPSNETDGKEGESVAGSHEEDSLRMRWLDMLVCIWQHIVKKFSSASDNTILLLMRSLEVFVLRSIYGLTMEMHNYLIQMDSLHFLEKMAKVSLLHRFGDPATLETLRHIFSSLSDGNLPIALFLQLLLGHSQLALTIDTVGESSNSTMAGMVVKPISSLLRSLIVPTERHDSEKCERYRGKLEVIKLLRLLFHLRAHQRGSASEDDLGVNSRELLLLLLPSYGATVNEMDLEIYGLLSEIEYASGMDHRIIADLDYLWGSAALRVRKEPPMEHVSLNNDMEDEEDRRRSRFRDNLPIDAKLLIETILHFPYGRTISEKPIFLDSSKPENIRNTVEEHSAEVGRIDCYDPVFLLSFSIHTLSMGYLDPVEFAGLGLLAIALVSIASPEDGIRKLGYDVLSRFKDALKGCQKKREVTRLKLLLTYLQNGIQEPWQKISTIAAVFVAEASVILLDASHDHYPAISKILMQSPRMNLKSIPLFHDFIWSSSVNFRKDRLWMLRLLHAGINLEDDAQIYIRNSVLEILLSVYSSPLSDKEAKELILQVVKKAVKVQKMARYLIENCCLISWLSSVLSLSLNPADGHERTISKQMILLLEVIHEIYSSKSAREWLQKNALEQLSDLSCHLFKLLVRCSKLVQETVPLGILILETIASALKISQQREIYQPHFTLSIQSLYQLHQAVVVHDSGRSSRCAELGLKAILTSIPPTTFSDLDEEELSQFLMWAVSTAVQSDSPKGLHQTGFSSLSKTCLEEEEQEDSLVSTLLRWLVASVILSRVSCSDDNSDRRFVLNRETLLSFMRCSKNKCGQNKLSRSSRELSHSAREILAAVIFHLQQLLGMKCRVLPSVVAALSMLLLSDGPHTAGSATTTSCESSVPSIWSKICYPPEANPAWRWSSCEPWANLRTECTDLEKMVELHACRKLLVMISGMLRKKQSVYQLLSPEDLESSGLFEWERTNLS